MKFSDALLAASPSNDTLPRTSYAAAHKHRPSTPNFNDPKRGDNNTNSNNNDNNNPYSITTRAPFGLECLDSHPLHSSSTLAPPMPTQVQSTEAKPAAGTRTELKGVHSKRQFQGNTKVTLYLTLNSITPQPQRKLKVALVNNSNRLNT